MQTTDFYTGEPVNSGSPYSSGNEENIAANMASFGKYDYDPGARSYYQQPTSLMAQPVSYGYTYGGGIGTPPPNYNQYSNPQPTYGNYMGGYGSPNPVYNNPYNPYYNQMYYQQQMANYNPPKTITIPGISPFGEYMPPSDWESRLEEMEMEYVNKRINEEVKQEVDSQIPNSPYGYNGWFGGFNYYGAPYWNPYRYNSLNSEYNDKIEAMKDEARENRMNFTLQIARLAHNFSHQPISEEALRERYCGKVVEIPQVYRAPERYEDYIMKRRLDNLVPFDNSQIYRDHRAKVQREYNAIIPKDANLKETFDKMGIIAANWEMEEEQHRRKNMSKNYNSSDNSYKYFVRKKAKERYAAERGIGIPMQKPITPNPNDITRSYVASSPVLSQAASLADDGTLNVSLSIPCNVGSNAGSTYTVHNSQESEYDEKRERFGAFLNEIKGSIYLDQKKQEKLEGYSYE